MVQLYSVVPLPKLSEDKEYNTFIHNIGDAGAINVNTTKAVAISAFVQYCTENSGEIREEFLEIVTKYKTTKYNQGTDRMFDIIYNGMVNGREEMIDDNFAGDDRWHSMMKSTGYVNGSDYLIERYEALKGTKQNKLNQLLNTWYSLPKVEPTAE